MFTHPAHEMPLIQQLQSRCQRNTERGARANLHRRMADQLLQRRCRFAVQPVQAFGVLPDCAAHARRIVHHNHGQHKGQRERRRAHALPDARGRARAQTVAECEDGIPPAAPSACRNEPRLWTPVKSFSTCARHQADTAETNG